MRASMYSQLADAAAAAGRPDEAAELKTYIEPVFSGTIIYRTLIRLDELPEETKSQPVFNKHGMLLVRNSLGSQRPALTLSLALSAPVLRQE